MKFFLEHYDGVLLMLGAGGITISKDYSGVYIY